MRKQKGSRKPFRCVMIESLAMWRRWTERSTWYGREEDFNLAKKLNWLYHVPRSPLPNPREDILCMVCIQYHYLSSILDPYSSECRIVFLQMKYSHVYDQMTHLFLEMKTKEKWEKYVWRIWVLNTFVSFDLGHARWRWGCEHLVSWFAIHCMYKHDIQYIRLLKKIHLILIHIQTITDPIDRWCRNRCMHVFVISSNPPYLCACYT